MPMVPATHVRSNDAFLISGQGIYEESSTQKYALGTRIVVGDRVFFYASAGEALTGGNFIEAAALGGATTTLQNTCAVTVAAPIGTTRVYVNALSTVQAAALFTDGYAAIWDATTAGMCYLYRIKNNSSLALTGTTSYIDLYDELHIALTTSDQISAMTHMYKAVKQSNTTQAGCPLGVVPISVTSAYYFWLQTYGPAAVYPNAALDLAKGVVPGNTTDGTVELWVETEALPAIGFAMHIGTAAESSIVFLTIRAV